MVPKGEAREGTERVSGTDRTAKRGGDRPIRVVLQQIALPKYRVPVFRELANRPGIDLTLVYSESPGLPNVEPDGFKAVCVPMRRWTFLGQVFDWHDGQFAYFSRRNADVVVLSWSTRFLSLIPGLLRARFLGIPTIVWGHGVSKRRSRWRLWLRGRVARLARATLFYNRSVADQFVASGFPEERVFIAANSLDQGPIQAARAGWMESPDRLRAFQREQGLEGRRTILFVSRLEPANRVDLLIKAGEALRAKYPDLLVLIVGSGQAREELERVVVERELSGTVRFLGAIYDEANLAAYFASSRVFCYPSNMGLSLLHAFGYGLPVVTGDDAALHGPEIDALRDGENGLLFRHGDVDSLVGALDRVLGDDDLRERLSGEAHRTVLERYSVAAMVDGFEAAIRYCAARKKG